MERKYKLKQEVENPVKYSSDSLLGVPVKWGFLIVEVFHCEKEEL